MADITPLQRRVIRSVALLTALIGGVLFVLGLADRIDLPLTIPLLLFAGAAGLLLATGSRRS
jgi:hypothetical protein